MKRNKINHSKAKYACSLLSSLNRESKYSLVETVFVQPVTLHSNWHTKARCVDTSCGSH